VVLLDGSVGRCPHYFLDPMNVNFLVMAALNILYDIP